MSIAKEVAALAEMAVKDLRLKYAQLFGEATTTGNKPWLIKRLAWRMQALAEGGLSERARQRAAELANEADLRLLPPKTKDVKSIGTTVSSAVPRRLPPAGTIITRSYKGRNLAVEVLDDGFAFEGERFKSLSAVAKAITGCIATVFTSSVLERRPIHDHHPEAK
jgi:hypothetical protein